MHVCLLSFALRPCARQRSVSEVTYPQDRRDEGVEQRCDLEQVLSPLPCLSGEELYLQLWFVVRTEDAVCECFYSGCFLGRGWACGIKSYRLYYGTCEETVTAGSVRILTGR